MNSNFKKEFSYLKKRNIFYFIFFIFVLILILWSFVSVKFEVAFFGWETFIDNLRKVFQFSDKSPSYPSYSLWELSFNLLFITIKNVIIGTTIGFILAIISSYISYHKFSNKYLAFTINFIINILRCLPILMFIYYFQLEYDKQVSLLLILIWFSWLWTHKYLLEIYKSIDYSLYNNLLISGNNKIIAFLNSVYYQINTRVFSLYLYSFESNVRWSTILSSLGLIGIGELIIDASNNDFANIGIPIFTISTFLIFLELIIFLIKKIFINEDIQWIKKNFSNHKYISFIKIKRTLILFCCLIVIAFFIYFLSSTNWSQIKIGVGNSFIKNLFNPNFSVINSGGLNNHIIVEILFLLNQTIVIIFIAFSISVVFLFFGNKFLFPRVYLFIVVLTTLLRSIPVVAYFFVIDGLYITSTSSICLALALPLSTIIFKVINEKIEKMSTYNVAMFKVMGKNKINIFYNYLLLKNKNNLFNVLSFEFENSFRNIILYGSFGSSQIGFLIDDFFKKGKYAEMSAFLWIVFFLIFLIWTINTCLNWFLCNQTSNNFNKFKVFNFKGVFYD